MDYLHASDIVITTLPSRLSIAQHPRSGGKLSKRPAEGSSKFILVALLSAECFLLPKQKPS